MDTVSFTAMADGTQEDYDLLEQSETEFAKGTADRILDMLRALDGSYGGYKISRLEHCLQSATLAERDGASEEVIMAALLHDIGDGIAPFNHSEMAAAVLKPYVSEKTYWIVKHHGVFQGYYYFHYYGGDRNARDLYKDHRWYQDCIDFCDKYDQCAFDPDYEHFGLDHFEDRVRKLFDRETFIEDRERPGS